MSETDNRVSLAGTLVEPPNTRRSPAGVPITRLLLEHSSEQAEAGVNRAVRFRIGVRASGEGLADGAAGLAVGERIRVEGFLARIRLQPEDNRLIVTALRIERIDGPAETA